MKRPTIKGKGREIFFPESQPQTSPTPNQGAITPSHQQTSTTPQRRYGKVTFWFPPDLIKKLDAYWIERRAHDKRATKSGIATQALDEFLKRRGRVS